MSKNMTAQEAADHVAFLLRQGRHKEVDNQLMKLADPNRLREHYISGNTGELLPMDKSSRMNRAKDMGYNVDKIYYHAGNEDRSFSNDKGEIYATVDKALAKSYQEDYDRKHLLPLLSKHKKTIEGDDLIDTFNNDVSTRDKDYVGIKHGWQALNSEHLENLGGDPQDAKRLLTHLKNQGYDSAFFDEDYSPMGDAEPASSRAFFYPEELRHVDARFDPRLSHVSDLHAANGGVMAEYIPHDDKRRAKNLKDFHGKTPKEIREGRWLHGTIKDFESFKRGPSGAIFVTQDPNFADIYAKSHWGEQELSDDRAYAKFTKTPPSVPNVMRVHVRAEKPFDYENKKHIAALYETLGPDLIMDPYLHSFMDEVREGHWGAIESAPIQNAIKAMGHDSFYVKENGVKNLGVYDPSQIKSATGNQGTFDPTNPDITKREGGDVEGKSNPAKNFSKWFGRSKLVDKDGKPMVLFHGTDRDFSKFDPRKHGASDHGWYGVGHYLTADPKAASSYSAFRGSDDAIMGQELHEGANVMPVHARLENPYIWPENRPAATSIEESIAITRQLMNMGYDGVIAPNYYDDGPYASHHEVVVFRPHQIKSATGNNGDYDPFSADITKADGGEIDDQPSSVVDLGQARDAKRLNDFHSNLMGQVRDTAREMGELIADHRESGNLPFDIGTRFTTKHSRENNLPPFKVTGYFVNRKNPDEHYGYHVERQMSADPEDVEKTTVAVRHPRLEKLHGPEKWAELTAGFRPFMGLSVAKADGGALSMLDEERDPVDGGIIAYHGSPHDFEQFDVSKIGMGEGNQAYGHGLYFAQNEKVAKNYRDMLAPEVPSEGGTMADAYSLSREQHAMMDQNDLDAHFSDIDNNSVEKIWRNGKITHFFDDGSALVDEGDHLRPVKKGKGHMYEVHIKAHPDHFLDWDEVLEDQSDHIKNALRRVAEHDEAQIGYSDLHDQLDEPEGYTGGAFYQTLADRGRAKEASEIFKQMGIKGIRYKDAGSRIGNEEPTYNYVVFDHDHVRVRRKYKQGGAV